ncbi:MAG TPA: hypothetical protein VLV88_15500 [Terriglobales bacterium]|nr:hypothetical protein [Terriglobales bacterium]HUL17402.1 hypothetical protein [Terriglobales bacterium]
MPKIQKSRSAGAIVLLLALLAAATSLTRLHSRPAFLVGFAGGALMVFGVYLIFRK